MAVFTSLASSAFSGDFSINDIITQNSPLHLAEGNTYTYTFSSLRHPSATDPTTLSYWGFGNFPEDRVLLDSSILDSLSSTDDKWTIKMYVQAQNYPQGFYNLFYSADNSLLTSDKPSFGGAKWGYSDGSDLGGKVEIIMNLGSADITYLSVGSIAASNDPYFRSKNYVFPTSSIPEPSSLSLLVLGGVLVALKRRK
jgi:hypothetical protein